MTPAQPRHDPGSEALPEYLKRNRSFDFTGYERSTFLRRVAKRMRAVEVDRCAAYAARGRSTPTSSRSSSTPA